MPREFTPEEVRNQVLDHVWHLVHYWEHETSRETERERMQGLAFGILSMLDGCVIGLPKFIVAPDPHPTDAAYHQEQGENYFPANTGANVNCDLGGSLHELFYSRRPAT